MRRRRAAIYDSRAVIAAATSSPSLNGPHVASGASRGTTRPACLRHARAIAVAQVWPLARLVANRSTQARTRHGTGGSPRPRCRELTRACPGPRRADAAYRSPSAFASTSRAEAPSASPPSPPQSRSARSRPSIPAARRTTTRVLERRADHEAQRRGVGHEQDGQQVRPARPSPGCGGRTCATPRIASTAPPSTAGPLMTGPRHRRRVHTGTAARRSASRMTSTPPPRGAASSVVRKCASRRPRSCPRRTYATRGTTIDIPGTRPGDVKESMTPARHSGRPLYSLSRWSKES